MACENSFGAVLCYDWKRNVADGGAAKTIAQRIATEPMISKIRDMQQTGPRFPMGKGGPTDPIGDGQFQTSTYTERTKQRR